MIKTVMQGTIIKKDFPEIMTENFTLYSLSILLSRAIPAIDGLKPVTRRILYTFNNDVDDTKRFKKGAYFIGVCQSRYHPHGDLSLFETMIGLSQTFLKPNVVIDAQGNNGSIKDPKSYAASRYVELRSSKFASDIFFKDFNSNIVNMVQTFDPDVYEPMYLTPTIPMILLMGNTGIGVGYSVDIPTHNLTEVCNATIAKIKNPDLTTQDLMTYIKGPDYACGGMITNSAELCGIYDQGRGKIRVQASIKHVQHKGKDALEIYGIPATTDIGKVMEQITTASKPNPKTGKPGPLQEHVYDILEIADVGKIALVVLPKKDVALNVLENLLYENTSLRDTQSYQANVLIDGQFIPNLPLDIMLDEWIKFRLQTIRKLYAFKVSKKSERLFIVKALIKCHNNLDAIIKILKSSTSKADAKANLIAKYKFADKEAEYIVEQKLYKISSLEIQSLHDEQKAIEAEIDGIISIISSDSEIRKIAIADINDAIKKYGKPRITTVTNINTKMEVKDLIEEKNFLVAIAEDGYIYSTDIENIRHTSRSTKGFTMPDVKKGKAIEKTFILNNHTKLMCFTEFGRLFILDAYQLNVNNTHISNIIENLNGEKLVDFVAVNEDDAGYIVILTKTSILKKTPIQDYLLSRRTTGLLAFKNDDKSERIVAVEKSTNEDDIAIIGTTRGYMSKLILANVASTSRVTKGRACIRFKEDDEEAINLNIVEASKEAESLVFLISKNGIGKLTPLSELLYKKTEKGISSAHLALKLNVGDKMLKANIIGFDHSIVINTEKLKTIKVKASEISLLKRAAMGNRVIKLNDGDLVKNVNVIED